MSYPYEIKGEVTDYEKEAKREMTRRTIDLVSKLAAHRAPLHFVDEVFDLLHACVSAGMAEALGNAIRSLTAEGKEVPEVLRTMRAPSIEEAKAHLDALEEEAASHA